MTNPEIDKNRYDDAYQAFLTRDMWPFVASVLQVTQNISPDRRYYFAGNGASTAIASLNNMDASYYFSLGMDFSGSEVLMVN